MSKQTLAQNWRIEQIFYDDKKSDFAIILQPLGKFMRATAIEKVAAKAKQLGYKFRVVHSHGSGGYWVGPDGETMTLLPCNARA